MRNLGKMRETKNPALSGRIFGVDPAGIEPASSCDNNEMLAIYTTGPGPRSYNKLEKALFQGLFLSHTSLPAVLRTSCCLSPLYIPH